MKRILKFILPILIIVSIIFVGFGLFEARKVRENLTDEVQRKAKAVAESMEMSVAQVLLAGDMNKARRLIGRFEARERLQGCIIYSDKGQVFTITKNFAEWGDIDKPYVAEALQNKKPRGGIERYKNRSVYSYILPVLDDEGQTLGLIEVVYDTSYIFNELTNLWRNISITLLVLLTFILLTSFLLHRQFFSLPVKQLTDWFHHFQKGSTNEKPPIQGPEELGKLAGEVEQVALSFRVARQSMIDEAQERVKQDDSWTEARLRDLVMAKLGEQSLFVVSNREPYIHTLDEKDNEPRCIWPASGVVTAIDPILRTCGGMWIAHGSGNADRQFVNSQDKLGVPPNAERYILKRVWLSKEEEEKYYYGFSNEGLWPLCHITHTRPLFRETDWLTYKEVNKRFAESVLSELPPKNPIVFIQDYHFTLLPQLIKEKRPDATIALFWHIPWPNPEVFSICPYKKEILTGMLGCDLLGFHVQFHCNNFLDTVNRLLESRVNTERFSVVMSGRETLVRAFPISVAVNCTETTDDSSEDRIGKIKKDFRLENKIIALSVERMDYTKGMVERIYAIDRFLEKYPQYLNRFVVIQVAAPSRTHIKHYHDFVSKVDELIERKNWKYGTADWQPIIYLKRHFAPEEIKPLYKMADLCMVSSLHDGMNLVAKEFVAAKRDLSGILILSPFTGAARELVDAIQVNPYAIEEFADAIKAAIEMPAEEKTRRMANMREVVSKNNVYKWAGDIITELTSMKKI